MVANANAVQCGLRAVPPNFGRANSRTASIIRNVDAAVQVVSRIRALFTQAGSQRQVIDLISRPGAMCLAPLVRGSAR